MKSVQIFGKKNQLHRFPTLFANLTALCLYCEEIEDQLYTIQPFVSHFTFIENLFLLLMVLNSGPRVIPDFRLAV